MNKNDNELIDGIFNHLRLKFDVEFTELEDFNPTDFSSFSHYVNLMVLKKIAIKRAGTGYLSFINSTSTEGKRGDIEHSDLQLWGSVKLKKDFGHVLIRPENLSDKLLELVKPTEIDFPEDKLFSQMFYVVANDRQKAITGMNDAFRNVVAELQEPDFVIEIIKDQLIIGIRKPASPQLAGQLYKFIVATALLH
ncbi:MAG: hypothetical protein EOP55_22595 [Sphingobacteriales bacterium]|nr:MAG: hypothetical protein EOP55_22595 [Sphingobacteriales bacterium]